jgi:hypothetical protein
MLSNDGTSNQTPLQRSHPLPAVAPIETDRISIRQRGQRPTGASASVRTATTAPHRGQCWLPTNIISPQEAHDTVANLVSQYLQSGSSAEIAAPHLGQLTVSESTSPNYNSFPESRIPDQGQRPGIRDTMKTFADPRWVGEAFAVCAHTGTIRRLQRHEPRNTSIAEPACFEVCNFNRGALPRLQRCRSFSSPSSHRKPVWQRQCRDRLRLWSERLA